MQLQPHPDTAVATAQEIDASIWQDAGRWHFRFLVNGATDLILPDAAEPGRADDLWQTTCFEVFVGLAGSAYLEFNFSPSGQWAAYRFDAPRAGMREAIAEVEVWLEGGEGWIAVEAAVGGVSLAPGAALNLTAVIEEAGGAKSYWALAHAPGAPDFHDRACFLGRLTE